MNTTWKEFVEDVINEVIQEKELYQKAIFLSVNKNKDDVVTSYSICIWEKDYPDTSSVNAEPDRNVVIINIKDPALKKRPTTLKLVTMDTNVEMPPDIEFVDNKTPYWILEKDSNNLRSYFKRLIEKAVDNYKPKADRFGCCSKFSQCSDACMCLHENLLYSKACFYRNNLEEGRIFYGNKNICTG